MTGDHIQKQQSDDDEFAQLFNMRLIWIPAPLHGREVLGIHEDHAAWVDAFRGFPGGFSFATHYRWPFGPEAARDVDAWPKLDAYPGTPDLVTITAEVDGHRRSNAVRGPDALHPAGSSGVPGISEATWWVPEIPQSDLVLSFIHHSAGFEGQARIDTTGWKDIITAGVIRLG